MSENTNNLIFEVILPINNGKVEIIFSKGSLLLVIRDSFLKGVMLSFSLKASLKWVKDLV